MKTLLATAAIVAALVGTASAAEATLSLEQIQRVGFVVAAKTLCANVEYQPEFDDESMRTLATYYLMDAPFVEANAFDRGSQGFVEIWREDMDVACLTATIAAPNQLRSR